MKFNVKTIAIISGVTFTGVALTKFSGDKMGTIFTVDPQIPGTFISEGNMNCNVRGKDYYGRFVGNANSDIRCEDTSIELLNNRNMHVDIIKSSVKAINQSNCKIFATSSTLDMKSNNNIDVHAEDVRCKFEDNSNLNFNGTGGSNEFLCQFVGNRNSKFFGKRNNLLVFNNNNLMIGGDNNHLEISKTRNHNCRPATLGSNQNTLTIRSSGRNSIQFEIEYVGSASINGSKYQLGIMSFDVVTSADNIKVTIHNAEDVIYSVVESSSTSKIVIQAERNGVTQTLELKGQRVYAVSFNSFMVFC